ncbi:hypothetical protein [Clostridium butyricum]|uniref:hypothetical protein n=1 Tax=Clostridium butyricum TaxID=1492 RepID=UPI001F4C20B8|nr:hypothetical protein [Clostridium butyricum]NOW24635.1 hypothetical protein [Clostridium butyricum]
MLKLTAFEFLLRTVPEAFILMASLFVLCNVKIRAKKYIISSVILGFVQYSVRRLPINYGVNSFKDRKYFELINTKNVSNYGII